MELQSIGWNSRLQNEFERFEGTGFVPGRVIEGQRELSTVLCAEGELLAEVSGKFRLAATAKSDYPVVGDWVALAPRSADRRATIHALLPRASCFSRKAASGSAARHVAPEEQVVAANIDLALIVMGLDRDWNLRRLERYLILAWGSGAQPLVALNKVDLCPEAEARLAETEAVAIGVPVLAVSAEQGTGIEALEQRLAPGTTATLLGSSGVGKSTLINRLLGVARMDTGAVREDDGRGRHTTTHREMILLPSGALLIDNPGMREVGLWAEEEDLGGAFADIETLAQDCRFSDCKHAREPGCAVRTALEAGSLDAGRYESWRRLQRELEFLASRGDLRAATAKRAHLKAIAKYSRSFRKDRRHG